MGNIKSLRRSKGLQSVYTLSPYTPRQKRIFSFKDQQKHASLSRLPTDGQLLSEHDKFLLKKSWACVDADLETLGQQTYLRIFQTDADLKLMFGWEDIPDSQLPNNATFKRQSIMIIQVFKNCMDQLDELKMKYTIDYLEQLGERHARIRGFGFTKTHWQLYQYSILQSIDDAISNVAFLSKQERMEALLAWDNLITFIISTMVKGYDNAIKRQSYDSM